MKKGGLRGKLLDKIFLAYGRIGREKDFINQDLKLRSIIFTGGELSQFKKEKIIRIARKVSKNKNHQHLSVWRFTTDGADQIERGSGILGGSLEPNFRSTVFSGPYSVIPCRSKEVG